MCLIVSACNPAATPTEVKPPATNTPIPPIPTVTPTPLPPMVTANEQVNCYSGPGENGYVLVTAIESGTQMEVVGKDASGKYWIVIDPKSNKGCWVESQYTSTQGETSALPVRIPAPTMVARPNPPEKLKATYHCAKKNSWTFEASIVITWDDKSDNETGFEIYKNGNLWKTVEANATQIVENFEAYHPIYGSTNYTILAFNDVGKSTRVEKLVQYHCP